MNHLDELSTAIDKCCMTDVVPYTWLDLEDQVLITQELRDAYEAHNGVYTSNRQTQIKSDVAEFIFGYFMKPKSMHGFWLCNIHAVNIAGISLPQHADLADQIKMAGARMYNRQADYPNNFLRKNIKASVTPDRGLTAEYITFLTELIYSAQMELSRLGYSPLLPIVNCIEKSKRL